MPFEIIIENRRFNLSKGAAKRPAFPGITPFVRIRSYNGECGSGLTVLLIRAVISGDEPMVVLDTLADWRFAHNVGDNLTPTL